MKIAEVGDSKKLFGGILPFLGWRVVNVDNDGNPCAEKSHFKADAFSVEWLGFGAILYIGKVSPASEEAEDVQCIQINIVVVHSTAGGEMSYSREQALKYAHKHLVEQFHKAVPKGRQCTVLSGNSQPFKL